MLTGRQWVPIVLPHKVFQLGGVRPEEYSLRSISYCCGRVPAGTTGVRGRPPKAQLARNRSGKRTVAAGLDNVQTGLTLESGRVLVTRPTEGEGAFFAPTLSGYRTEERRFF